MTRWISLACALIVLTGAAVFVYQMLPEPVPEPTIELHRPRRAAAEAGARRRRSTTTSATMAVEAKGSHTWEFKNVGEGPLEVWLEETTCSCTVATLKSAKGERERRRRSRSRRAGRPRSR